MLRKGGDEAMNAMTERFSTDWWLSVADSAINLPSQDEDEFLEWLLEGWDGDRDETWNFAEVFVTALRELLSFDAIIEFDIYVPEDKPITYLILTVVDKKTLICITAQPQHNLASISYVLSPFSSLDELNEFLKQVVADIEDAYRQRVCK